VAPDPGGHADRGGGGDLEERVAVDRGQRDCRRAGTGDGVEQRRDASVVAGGEQRCIAERPGVGLDFGFESGSVHFHVSGSIENSTTKNTKDTKDDLTTETRAPPR